MNKKANWRGARNSRGPMRLCGIYPCHPASAIMDHALEPEHFHLSKPIGMEQQPRTKGSRMRDLRQRIMVEGQNLGSGILKIDSFLNHQLDVGLMEQVGEEIARRFSTFRPDRILTAEVSGIVPAALAAKSLDNIPVVYARKHKPITMSEPVYIEVAPSHTKGTEVNLMVSPEFLHADDRVLIVDDFLATGRTIEALARIVRNAQAQLVGISVVVEKSFEGGRLALEHWGVPIESVVEIADMRDGKITLVDQ
jgi:xanthine phosphoribosyltransferase